MFKDWVANPMFIGHDAFVLMPTGFDDEQWIEID